jgi:hypothetical protein
MIQFHNCVKGSTALDEDEEGDEEEAWESFLLHGPIRDAEKILCFFPPCECVCVQ